MGISIFKAIGGATGGTFEDFYLEAIECPYIDNKTIAMPGVKMRQGSKRNVNNDGEAGIVSNGSIIHVEENTVMLTIDGGKITNLVAEPGYYKLDNSSAPSIFAGDIKDSFKDLFKRVAYGGVPSTQQRVLYINLQRFPGIKFGTSTPIPYPDPRYNTTVELRMHGSFEVQIPDAEAAVKFYMEVMSKGSATATRATTVEEVFSNNQYKGEFMLHLVSALNSLALENYSYNMINTQVLRLCDLAREASAETWGSRGLMLTGLQIEPISITDDSKKLLGDRLKADTMLDPNAQRAMMASSIARATEAAAANEAGAMMGFMGMNMAQMAGANVMGGMPTGPMGGPTNAGMGMGMGMGMGTPQAAPAADGWTCACGATATGAFCSNCGAKKPAPAEAWTCSCGAENTGKFCAECGTSKEGAAPAPKATDWVCSCGQSNTTKFCSNCGSAKPAAPKKFKCDKCGFIPEDPTNPPKFCPECGDPFNEEDAE